jgi:hypothetical protein
MRNILRVYLHQWALYAYMEAFGIGRNAKLDCQM